MITLIYAALSIGFLILVTSLLRNPHPHGADGDVEEKRFAPAVGNGRWLDLSERIFDPSDARWLEEELAFPKLARALMLDRKRLAIRWLEALQASFDDLLRTPEIAPTSDPEATAPTIGGWQMLWMVIRFKCVVSYALLVVKLFGPYHRLIPSFAWVPLSQGSRQSIRHAALAGSRTSD
jgi:hypothetical protein